MNGEEQFLKFIEANVGKIIKKYKKELCDYFVKVSPIHLPNKFNVTYLRYKYENE